MKPSPTMQRIIRQLVHKHGVNLAQMEAHLRLDMPGYERLVIEQIGYHRVSVAHYFELNGDLVPDPDVVFFTGTGAWVPMGITHSFGFAYTYARLNTQGTQLVLVDSAGQHELADFTEQWAQNIIDQGWLTAGACVRRG